MKLNFDDFAADFGPWADDFRPMIESKEMYDIYQRIKSDAYVEKDGKLYRREFIVPASDKTFRAFATTFPENLKSIWYLMDPYPRRYKGGIDQATGIAMDCSNSPDGKLQPSLEKFYESMSQDIGHEVERSTNLEYLHSQGVMLLNTDLTCKLNKTGSHEKLWDPFQKFFLEEIMAKRTGLIYVLAGKVSQRMERYIQPLGNYIFKIEHPAAASHKNSVWDCQKIFTKTNKILKENTGKIIHWDKRDWDKENQPPF